MSLVSFLLGGILGFVYKDVIVKLYVTHACKKKEEPLQDMMMELQEIKPCLGCKMYKDECDIYRERLADLQKQLLEQLIVDPTISPPPPSLVSSDVEDFLTVNAEPCEP